MTKRRLIEEELPLQVVNAESKRDKSIRHGHISTLHFWRTRKPLALSRAVVFATLLPDPGDDALRKELLKGLDEAATKSCERLLWRLTDERGLSRLLRIEQQAPAPADGTKPAPNLFAGIRIDEGAIYEFNRIMWEPGFPTARPTGPATQAQPVAKPGPPAAA